MNHQQYELVKKLMTIPRFCGLLQSDGHFTVTYDKQKVQNPKIILTQSSKSLEWLYGIKDWLASLGVKSVLPKIETLHKKIHMKRSINLTIDRVNCRKLLFLIEKAEKTSGTFLLFDEKRISYLLVNESIFIKQKNRKTLTKYQAMLLVDIKCSGLTKNRGFQKISEKELIKRLGFPKINTKNCACLLLQTIKEEAKNAGEKTIQNLLKNPTKINAELAEFLSGVFDGDGSFYIALLTILSQEKTKLPGRSTFRIVPSLTLTTHREKNQYLFKIWDAVFGGRSAFTTITVNAQGQGRRLVIQNINRLKQYVIPFFEKNPPCIQKNQTRFKIFCNVLKKLPLDYKNKQQIIEMVCEIYKTDLYQREKTLEEYLKIVELYYN